MDTISPPANSDKEVLRLVSTARKRLFWRLSGPLEYAITVVPPEYYDPAAVLEPYFRPASTDHDAWEQTRADQHSECYDAVFADSNRRRIGPRPGDETLNAPIYVLECYGQERPWSQDKQLEVVAAAAVIYEYVSAVHPWLMGMRNTLLDVLGKMDGKPPWPAETKLAVLYLGPGPLHIGRENEWDWWHKRPPTVRSTGGDPSGEECSRKAIERAKARAKAMVRARQEAAS
jgi:hypothetical protein